jgi:putative membrane protein
VPACRVELNSEHRSEVTCPLVAALPRSDALPQNVEAFHSLGNFYNVEGLVDTATRFAIWVVVGFHIGFSVAEFFLWETLTPRLKVFDATRARETAVVGRNMGVYNGIMAACLIWLLCASRLGVGDARSLGTLLLSSIIIAGIFGGLTIKWTIPLFQSLPAMIALGLLWNANAR